MLEIIWQILVSNFSQFGCFRPSLLRNWRVSTAQCMWCMLRCTAQLLSMPSQSSISSAVSSYVVSGSASKSSSFKDPSFLCWYCHQRNIKHFLQAMQNCCMFAVNKLHIVGWSVFFQYLQRLTILPQILLKWTPLIFEPFRHLKCKILGFHKAHYCTRLDN